MLKMKKLNELTDSQKQQLVDAMLQNMSYPTLLQNDIVEYILSQSIEDTNAPFSYNDIENNNACGNVEINGYWHELTENECNKKVEFYEYLRDKAEQIKFELEDNSDDESRIERARANHERLANIVIDLDSMSFDGYPEIYQWFLIANDWLLNELQEAGQCILNNRYFGRQSCGLSFSCENLWQEIAYKYWSEYNFYTNNNQVFGILNDQKEAA